MKCVASRKPLLDAFNLAFGVTVKNSPKPILRHVLMVAGEDGTYLVATSLELTVKVPVVGCVVQEPGRAILDGERVRAALVSYPDDEIAMSTEDDKLTVKGRKSKTILNTDDPDFFPVMPEWPKDAPTWTVEADHLSGMTDRTSYATDPESTTYSLGGCLLELKAQTLGMVGCDGRRLSLMGCPLLSDSEDATFKPSIPPASLKLADKLFGKDAAPIVLAFTLDSLSGEAMTCHIRGQGGEMVTRLVCGRFPDYRRAIPSSFNATAKTTVELFKSAIKCAAIVTSEESRGIDLEFSEGTMTASAMVADRGQSDSAIDIEYSGSPISVTLQSIYLLEAMDRMDPATMLTIKLVNKDTAVTFTTEDGWLHTLMPLSRYRSSNAETPRWRP